MTIYIDGLLFLNFFFDFLLLLTVNIILKKNIPLFKLILGAFIGSLTILVLFLKISSLQLFFLKIYLGILMCLVTFGYKNIKNFLMTLGTFYIISILLGGFLYFLNLEFSYKNKGLIFFNNGLSINVIFLIIFSPIILYIYIKEIKMYKLKISFTYHTKLYIGKNIISLTGYLDTGNTLTYKKRPVILTNLKNNFNNKKIYIPYVTASGCDLLECIKIKKIEVIGLGEFKNIYLGFSKNIKNELLLNAEMGDKNDN